MGCEVALGHTILQCTMIRLIASSSQLPLSRSHRGRRPGATTIPTPSARIGVATKTRAKPKKPSQYKVLLLNDDYTPMEFVVIVLKRFFRMDMEEATRVMLHVHQKGVGVCGIFPYEVAETKVNQVMDFARQNQHPLQCTLEKPEARFQSPGGANHRA